MKRLLILICILSLLVLPVSAAEGEATYYLDDTDLTMTGSWSRSFLDPGCYDGTAATGSSGASAKFWFTGSAFTIYGLTYYNSGYYYVYVDGQSAGRFTQGQSLDYVDNVELYTVSGLDVEPHVVTIVCDSTYVERPDTGRDTAGRLYIDYVTYDSPVSEQSVSDYDQVLLILILLLLIIILITNIWRNWRLTL